MHGRPPTFTGELEVLADGEVGKKPVRLEDVPDPELVHGKVDAFLRVGEDDVAHGGETFVGADAACEEVRDGGFARARVAAQHRDPVRGNPRLDVERHGAAPGLKAEGELAAHEEVRTDRLGWGEGLGELPGPRKEASESAIPILHNAR